MSIFKSILFYCRFYAAAAILVTVAPAAQRNTAKPDAQQESHKSERSPDALAAEPSTKS